METTSVRRETISGYLKARRHSGAEARPAERIEIKTGNFRRQGLERRVGRLVWNDGRPRSRNEMLDVLSGLPTPARQVVILQPHLTKRTYVQGRAGGTSASRRLVQIDTLLLGAEA